MSSTLFGVGVGPGAPDLVTLRAVAVLRRAAVLAAPRASDGATSLALRIAREAAGDVPGQEVLTLTFPMTRDREERRAARIAASDAICARLSAGRDVAFVTEGDPLLYSTFVDVFAAARAQGARVEVVPAVSSITAVAASAQVPLADGDDRVAILPAERALPDLARLAGEFETLVLVKAGRNLPAIRGALAAAGLLDRSWVIAEASRPGEWVASLEAAVGVRAEGYFTTVLVRTRSEEGEP